MPRKTTDNPEARTAAADQIAEKTGASAQVAGDVVTGFEAIDFERTTAKIGGSEVTLRRIVMTGPWEVSK